jgi:mRNA interferase YafQ
MATSGGPDPRRVRTTSTFEKDLKRLDKRGKDLRQVRALIEIIRQGQRLGPRHRDHAFKGEWLGCRECHVQPDWLLVYSLDDERVYLVRTGTHSDIFGE